MHLRATIRHAVVRYLSDSSARTTYGPNVISYETARVITEDVFFGGSSLGFGSIWGMIEHGT